jgi:hypothetical protein
MLRGDKSAENHFNTETRRTRRTPVVREIRTLPGRWASSSSLGEGKTFMHIKTVTFFSLLLAAALCSGHTVYAQRPAAAKAYKLQFFELSAKVKSVSKRIEQQAGNVTNPQDEIGIRTDTLELFKAVHELQRKAMQSYMDGVQSGQSPDKALLLVNQGCLSLDFIIQAINSNIYTHDQTFLELVKEGGRLLDSIEKRL